MGLSLPADTRPYACSDAPPEELSAVTSKVDAKATTLAIQILTVGHSPANTANSGVRIEVACTSKNYDELTVDEAAKK